MQRTAGDQSSTSKPMHHRHNVTRRQGQKRKQEAAAEDVSLELNTKKCLNVAVGGRFYEKASSRRSRHRAVLQAHAASQAVALKPTSTNRRVVAQDSDEEDPYAAAIMRRRDLVKQQQERRMTQKKVTVTKRTSASNKVLGQKRASKLSKAPLKGEARGLLQATEKTKEGNTSEDAIEIDL